MSVCRWKETSHHDLTFTPASKSSDFLFSRGDIISVNPTKANCDPELLQKFPNLILLQSLRCSIEKPQTPSKTMPPLQTFHTLRVLRTTTFNQPLRTFISTTKHLYPTDSKSPAANLPDPSPNSSAAPNASVRSDTQNTDRQSSASKDEDKTGDDHPAKQPDYQAEPKRGTGIGGQEEVKGGKAGLGERGV
ncbi:hypothetical protein IAQ61_003827 [Plenodomus lingam]|nr:hypothetical protein IAQ61_003827 [Plenodomus lingam]